MITCLQHNGEQFDSATRLQTLLVSRSVADHRTVNANVVGSIPTLPAILYGCGILVVQHSPKVLYEGSIPSIRAILSVGALNGVHITRFESLRVHNNRQSI